MESYNLTLSTKYLSTKYMSHLLWEKCTGPDISPEGKLICHDSGSETKRCVEISYMVTSSNGIIFRVAGHLCGEFTGHRWIPRTKASDAEHWCFLWSAPEYKQLSKQSWGWWFETLSSHYDVTVMGRRDCKIVLAWWQCGYQGPSSFCDRWVL